MSTPFSVTRRVEFGDTDMAGIVHFSNFFRYMEAAETSFLRARGLSVAWFEGGTKYGFPRVSVGCDYQRPARFEDELAIAVAVEKVGRKSVSYRFDFSLAGQPVAVGRMTAVFARSDPRGGIEALDIPPDVRAKLEA
jgi:YbgC/YbaW family acyl-CoA thioester hydrolase